MVEIGFNVTLTKDIDASIYNGTNIQAGVYNPRVFFELDHKDIANKLRSEGANVISFHFPELDIFEPEKLLRGLEIIRKHYKTGLVTIHPNAGSYLEARVLLEKNTDRIQELDVILAYENFERKRNKRWMSCADTISTMPSPVTGLTYDTSHVPLNRDILADIQNAAPRLRIVHLSNATKGEGCTQNHKPYEEGSLDLEPALKHLYHHDFKGQIILDYNTDEATKLRDFEKLRNRFRAP